MLKTIGPELVDVAVATERRTQERRNAPGGAVPLRSIAFLVLLWGLTQFASMFAPPLLDDVDAIHAEAAREMVVRHDYVTLYVDGIRYLDKPPLPYWMGAGAMHLFGQTDVAVRSVLALAMLVLTVYLYLLGRRLFGERAGFYAGVAIATAIGPFVYTRFFIPDIMVGLWMTVAFDLTLRMIDSAEVEGRARPWQAALFAVTCTAAVLTKGLIGVVFPVALLLAFLLVTRRTGLLARMRPILGTLVFAVTALPWHLMAAWQNGASGASRGFVWFYFVNDQINRYLNKRIPHDYDKVPLLLFYALLFVWILPWGVFLLRAAVERWRAWRDGGERDLRGATTLLTLWVLIIVGFFTFSTRQEYYTLPAIPALALLAGVTLARRDGEYRRGRAAYATLFVASAVLAAVCLGLAVASKSPAPGADLANVLERHPDDYRLSFGHLFDFTTEAFGFFRVQLTAMAVSLLLPTGLALLFKVRGRAFAANIALAVGMVGVLTSVRMGLEVFYPILGSAPLAHSIAGAWRPGDRVVLDGEYSNGSSIQFYLREPVLMLNGRVNNLWYGSLYADAPQRFVDDAGMMELWRGKGRVFFVTHDRLRTEGWLQRYGGSEMAASGGKFVVVNR